MSLLENPNLAPDERLMEVVRVVGQLAGTSALLLVNLRGTRQDAANLTQQNRHLPAEMTPEERLAELQNPNAEVDLDRPRRAEGATAEDVHTTIVQTTPGQVGRRGPSKTRPSGQEAVDPVARNRPNRALKDENIAVKTKLRLCLRMKDIRSYRILVRSRMARIQITSLKVSFSTA